MAELHSIDKDSQSERRPLELLHGLIYDMLLVTDGRTTELLETMLNDKIVVQVVRQEQMDEEQADVTDISSGAPYYIRESILIGEKSRFVVSHNIAVVQSDRVPASLFEKIAHRQEGIGKAINALGIRSFRKVADSGRIASGDAADLFGNPIKLRLPEANGQVPYKKYFIYFGTEPGIQMLEYYHPDIVRRRLRMG